MLVLTRKREEEIVIVVPGHEPIVVKIVGIRGGGKIRIGVTAEPDIVIHRREVYEMENPKTRSDFRRPSS